MKAIILVAALIGCKAARSAPADLRVYESPTDSSITEGETTLEIDPDTAYKTVTDYARWTVMFPDVHQVVITKQQGVDARVTFIGPNDHHDNVHFHNQPAARMVWFEDTGGSAEVWAEIVFIPGDRPGTTRMHSRLFATVHGVASLVVSDMKIRLMREQRVHDDLFNLRNYFAKLREQQSRS
ncbi:MAG: hypothetical protein JWO36_4690 [Myxococcales bacterium]|nr:hypothetical protein [Myxococcales bacterium]